VKTSNFLGQMNLGNVLHLLYKENTLIKHPKHLKLRLQVADDWYYIFCSNTKSVSCSWGGAIMFFGDLMQFHTFYIAVIKLGQRNSCSDRVRTSDLIWSEKQSEKKVEDKV
jgi:hypothetical protein